MKKLVTTSFILLSLLIPSILNTANAEQVAFNTHTYKVHNMSCRYATKSKNMIFIDRKDAYKRGGVACKICGG